jgi:type VI protein secretion system component Hcp
VKYWQKSWRPRPDPTPRSTRAAGKAAAKKLQRAEAELKALEDVSIGVEAPEGGRKMSLIRALSWCIVIMLLGGSGEAVAQSDVFMCVEGITGSSADAQFAGCSDIFGVSYSVGIEGGAPPRLGGGGGSASRPTCGLYVVSKAVDTSSIPILIGSLMGRHSPEVEFAIRKRGDVPAVVLELILRDVLIVQVEQNLAAGTGLPVETIVLQPREVNWTFFPQDPTGAPGAPIPGGFDCARNVAL